MWRSPYLSNSLLWMFLLCVATAVALFFGIAPIFSFFIGANFAAFAMFFVDKNAAGSAMGRVPEVVLYVALWFGIIGGFTAMMLVRHKTKKPAFQTVAALMLLIQFALVAYFIMPLFSGSSALPSAPAPL